MGLGLDRMGLGRETGHTGTGTECVYTLYSAVIGTFNEMPTHNTDDMIPVILCYH